MWVAMQVSRRIPMVIQKHGISVHICISCSQLLQVLTRIKSAKHHARLTKFKVKKSSEAWVSLLVVEPQITNFCLCWLHIIALKQLLKDHLRPYTVSFFTAAKRHGHAELQVEKKRDFWIFVCSLSCVFGKEGYDIVF